MMDSLACRSDLRRAHKLTREARRGRWRNNCLGRGGHIATRIQRQRGEAETPTSNQPPRVNQGRRLLGPAVLQTRPLASPRSQARAHLGPGGYCRRSGNGGPQTCLPAAHGVAKPAGRTTHLHQQGIKDPREADDARPPQKWPSQAGSRGAEISRRGKPHEALVM